MKLKSKLIATIVSICATIAVMGVGVWAATQSFTVTVTNTISLSFVNLEGAVSVKASTGVDNTVSGGATPSLTATTMYDNGTETYNAISASETADKNLQFKGANFFNTTNVDKDTSYATVLYEFTYTANDASSSLTSVTVSETGTPAVTGDVLTVAYYAKAEGQTKWTKLTSGTAVIVAAGKDVTILAVASYANPNHKSISTTTENWAFTVAFAATATGTPFTEGAVEMTGTITGGKLA